MRILLALSLALLATPAPAAEFRIMTTGAPRKAVDFVMERFGKEAGHTASFVQDTAGGVRRRIEGGETTDVIVATPDVLTALERAGKVAPGTRIDFATTGVGVGIKEGLPRPAIATVEDIRKLVTEVPSIALPDPKAGGTSAIYIEGMFKKLGLDGVVNPKAKLKAGGYAADLVAEGQAIIVFHQMSEIKPVKGVTLIGPLPAEIQLTTTYSAALAGPPRGRGHGPAELAAHAPAIVSASASTASMSSPIATNRLTPARFSDASSSDGRPASQIRRPGDFSDRASFAPSAA
jgi:molybdate transport system substrate-binding protein